MSFTDRDVALKSSNILVNIPTIENRDTDLYIEYNKRLDIVANDVYGSPTLWWLILCANPKYQYEIDIPKQTVLRIPFPLESIKEIFERDI